MELILTALPIAMVSNTTILIIRLPTYRRIIYTEKYWLISNRLKMFAIFSKILHVDGKGSHTAR